MAPLLAGGVRRRHEALGEEVAAIALRAERAFSPEHERSQLALGVIVGRVHPLALDEGPKSRGMNEDVSTGTGDVTRVAGRAPRTSCARTNTDRVPAILRRVGPNGLHLRDLETHRMRVRHFGQGAWLSRVGVTGARQVKRGTAEQLPLARGKAKPDEEDGFESSNGMRRRQQVVTDLRILYNGAVDVRKVHDLSVPRSCADQQEFAPGLGTALGFLQNPVSKKEGGEIGGRRRHLDECDA